MRAVTLSEALDRIQVGARARRGGWHNGLLYIYVPAPAALPSRSCAIAKAAIRWNSLIRPGVPTGLLMIG